MPDVNLLAVIVATLVAFVIGGTYYTVLGAQLEAIVVEGEMDLDTALGGVIDQALERQRTSR